MLKTRVSIFAILALVLTACSTSLFEKPTPTALPATKTPKPSPTPTKTPRPTSTPRPTATPDVVATQAQMELESAIQEFVDKGYIPSTNGELVKLDDYSQEMAKMNYLNFSYTGFDELVQNFVFFGDVSWESAAPVNYPEYSGCGFAHRVTDKDGFYSMLLTNDRVLLSYCDYGFNRCGGLGTTRGSGRLDFDSPASASMSLVVNEDHSYVMVDGAFIGEYTLFKDKLRDPGHVLYSIISGTNRDYGTRCEIKNPQLWIVSP